MDIESFLAPVSDSAPGGSDCGYTLEYQQLTVLSDYVAARHELAELDRRTKVEFQGENAESDLKNAIANFDDGRRRSDRLMADVKELMGAQTSPEGARKALVQRGEKLLTGVGKDIRVVQQLALAWMDEQGIAGLTAGFALIDGLLDRYGDAVYPQPDEDDPTDLSARAMVLSEMLSGPAFINSLRDCVILAAQGVGRFSGRDAEVMDAVLEDDHSDGARTPEHLRAIAQVVAQGDAASAGDVNQLLHKCMADIDSCVSAIDAVARRFVVGTIHGDRVIKLLKRIKSQLEGAMTIQSKSGEPVAQGEAVNGIGPAAHIATRTSEKGASTILETRYHAQQLILEICRFIEQTEPSHPAPLFLRRAERLLGAKNFFEIVRDMAPDALGELQRITGHRDDVVDQ